jgi:sugar lactone lactonase YvrE
LSLRIHRIIRKRAKPAATKEENMMHRCLLGLSLALAASAPAFAEDVPQIPYESVPNVLKMPPDMHLGEAAGVAVNSKGHIFVYSRSGSSLGPAYGNAASQLLEFSPEGTFIREIGKNLYAWSFAHTVRVDKDDNIWATDKGSDMLIKFNKDDGQVMMVFGRKSESSDEDSHPLHHPKPPLPAQDGRFRQPTDIAWDPEGNGYIADGYIKSRVAKVDKDGNWVKQWGGPGTEPGQFNTVHSIAADATGKIYVADRANLRIQVFDGDGKLLNIIKFPMPFDPNARPAIGAKPNLEACAKEGGTMCQGAPWALCITPGPNQVLYAADAYPGRIYKMTLDGKVLGWLGESGKQPKQFGWVHEIACPSENVLYVAEILNWRIQKLILNPGQRAASR